MAFVLKDRVFETSTTTGTGTFTLAGAKDGYQAFSAIGDGNTTYYVITDGTNWECGKGTYTASGTTLSRTQILSSSNSNSVINFPSGEKDVFCAVPSGRMVFEDDFNDVTFPDNVTVTNNIIVNGTVDGRDVATDGTKLDGIEANATADQTDAEIKTAYENNSNTNAFTDALLTKLNGIETGATADQTDAEIKTAYENNNDTNAFTNAYVAKLIGIEAGATADQTASEILTAIKTVDGSGSGLDADLLDGNEASAFLTAHPNISAASSSDNSGRTYIQDIILDSNGHVTGIATATETVVNTDTNTTYSAGNGLSLSGTTFLMSGSYSGTLSATQFTATSDLAKKENLEVVTDALSKVETLTGYTYTMKEDGSRKAGLIAQDVEKILPEAVNGQEGNKSLDYSATIALLVNAIKELKAQIESK